jgi:hypothetical protein
MQKPIWVKGDWWYVTCGTHNICKVRINGGWAFEAWRLPIASQRDKVSVKLGHWRYPEDSPNDARSTAWKTACEAVEIDLRGFQP